MEAPTLKELQNWMRFVLTDARGVNGALNDTVVEEDFRNHRARPARDLSECIVDQAPIARNDRLGIYSNAYFSRLLEMLAANFEFLHARMEDANFRYYAGAFFSAQGSRTHLIDEVALSFAAYVLETFPDSPVAPLAELEAAHLSAIFTSAAAPLDPTKLALFADEEKIAGVKLRANPTLQLLRSTWDLSEIWRTKDDEESFFQNERIFTEPRSFVVYRTPSGNSLTALNTQQEKILEHLQAGLSLGDICSKLSGTDLEVDSLMATLGDWLQSGIVVDVNF